MAERLCELLNDDVLRARMGDAAREHAETLSWDRSTDALLASYRKLAPAPALTDVPAAGG